jgi:serine/threonine-protein kinase
MDQKRWSQISQLFHAAREKSAPEREAFLEAQCGGDQRLYHDVRELLDADGTEEGLLADLVAEAARRLEEPMEGGRVGPYQIIRELGRGGMGRVFLAERADGQFEQMVALKLVRRGMDTDQILQRFRQERQILARLQHPNIARLVDGGVTEDGQPFFALEYVDGEPIDQYCDEGNLNVDQRLTLFQEVCQALVYAHSNLVVHRDLKPDNILATADGRIRLLDFGIAKLMAEDSGGTAITRTGLWVMTPAYASPEQVRGEHIGTASDVYSLGVILYELLTGVRPYEMDSRSPTEVERVVCSVQPEKPSTRVGKRTAGPQTSERDSGTRGADTNRLRRRLSGDLDVICLKALRKEPERRYGSVEALLEDVRRHQRGLPILARPDTISYRLAKGIGRHRVAVAAAALLVSLTSGLVTFYTMRLSAERDRAQVEAAKAGEVVSFMRGLFEVSAPSESLGETITARELLDEGARRIDEGLDGQPEVQAEMRQLIGTLYGDIGLAAKGIPLLTRAVEQYRELLGDESEETALAELDLASLYQDAGNVPAAEPLFRKGLATRVRLYGPFHPLVSEAREGLAYWLEANGEYDAAGEEYRLALAGLRASLPPGDDRIVSLIVKLGRYLRQRGDTESAEPLLRESLAAQRLKLGDFNLDVASTARNLASLLRDKGEYPEADSLFSEALATRRAILGESHAEVATTLNSYAILLDRMGETNRATAAYRDLIDIYEQIHGGPHPDLAAAYNNLAQSLRDAGQNAEAIQFFEMSIDTQDAVFRGDHPNRAFPLDGLASIYMRQGEPRRAEPLLREALEVRRAALAHGHRYIGESARDLGECLLEQSRFAEAEPLLLEAYGLFSEGEGPTANRTRSARELLISLYRRWGMPDRAAVYIGERVSRN